MMTRAFFATAVTVLLCSPLPAQTSKPIETIAVKDIRAGMRGKAYTVFQGTKPEPMEVEVLGILKNANGPKGDVILVRLGGEKADYAGVVAGMSGSPVYLDGKLAGALAFRIGVFSKEPIAGVDHMQIGLEVVAKRALHCFGFALPQQAVVHKDAGDLMPDGAHEQSRGN